MPNTYSQINIHAVFTVKNKDNALHLSFRDRLFEYIYGTIKNANQYPIVVGGYIDHIHIFFELNPDYKISDIIRMVKANSSKWINDNNFIKSKFSWQSGYGAFSYSRSQRDNVINYIVNQKEHHTKKTFRQEYQDFLDNYDILCEPKYLFDYFDELYECHP
jgi:REP element-mobilizing transposase RayT